MDKYKRRAQRAQQKLTISKTDSPNTEVNRLLNDSRNVSEVVKRKLLFGKVISRQIKENFKTTKSLNKKRYLAELVNGKLIKKYKFVKTLSSISSSKLLRYTKRNNVEKKSLFLEQAIQRFLEKDESSRILPGKKDVITRKKKKKQKRLLNDSMLNLYRQFRAENPKYSLSYTSFCRYRPFWILSPSAKTRDTCLCIMHENMLLIVKKLRMLNIIGHSFPDQLCKSMCCENQLNENCLSRNCGACNTKELKINVPVPEQKLTYKTWKIKKETVTVKGQEKITKKKTVKEEIEVTCQELITQLKEKIPKYELE